MFSNVCKGGRLCCVVSIKMGQHRHCEIWRCSNRGSRGLLEYLLVIDNDGEWHYLEGLDSATPPLGINILKTRDND